MAKPTIKQIKENHTGHFFDRETMKFFGDKMGSFRVAQHYGVTYVYRHPDAMVSIFGKVQRAGMEHFTVWEVKEDGSLSSVNAEARELVWQLR